ncbi:MAG: helix-turn-helix domain-containing protein [Clostridia bacterium]|nr:helix-turn-helix domain-containing protein [Clostridia bacterium]
MTFGERLYQLRKQKYISQEELADIMNVSRQSISKWELDQTYPDIDNLVRLAEYFDVSVDFLVTGDENTAVNENSAEDVQEQKNATEQSAKTSHNTNLPWHYEYKSQKTFKGIPLVHVNLGLGLYCAKGIIAVGNIAKGVIAVGGLSFGVISFGCLAIGLLAAGGLALGLILSLGGFALNALVAIGGISVGTYAFGGIAVGFYKAIGGIAVAKYPLGALNFYLGYKNSYLPILKSF